MSEKTSILLSDVTVKGDIVEKETLILDSKVDGDITAGKLRSHSGSNVNGNISASDVTLGGSSKGNINSDIVKVKSTADVDGVLTDGGMYYSDKGDVMKRFHTRDGMGVTLLKNQNIMNPLVFTIQIFLNFLS